MRRASFAVIAASAFGLASACSSAQPAALSVNGEEISQDEFNEALEILAEPGAGEGTAALQLAADSTGRDATVVADQLIEVALIRQELEERELEATEEDREFAEAQLPQDAPDLSPEAWEQLIDWGEERVALLRGLFDEQADPAGLLCLRVILVADEADADAVLAQLDGGADFAELSQQVSIDPALAESGGDLGCQSETFIPELQQAAAGLEVGEVAGPVTLEFGSVILQRNEATFEGTAASINETVLAGLLQQLRLDADVDIDPRYGRWDASADPPRVEPPDGPTVVTTTAAPPPESPLGPPVVPEQGVPPPTAPPPGG